MVVFTVSPELHYFAQVFCNKTGADCELLHILFTWFMNVSFLVLCYVLGLSYCTVLKQALPTAQQQVRGLPLNGTRLLQLIEEQKTRETIQRWERHERLVREIKWFLESPINLVHIQHPLTFVGSEALGLKDTPKEWILEFTKYTGDEIYAAMKDVLEDINNDDPLHEMYIIKKGMFVEVCVRAKEDYYISKS